MAFNFPSSPTANQEITGPGGQRFKWDGVRWIALRGGGFLPHVNPVFTGSIRGPEFIRSPNLPIPASTTTFGTIPRPAGTSYGSVILTDDVSSWSMAGITQFAMAGGLFNILLNYGTQFDFQTVTEPTIGSGPVPAGTLVTPVPKSFPLGKGGTGSNIGNTVEQRYVNLGDMTIKFGFWRNPALPAGTTSLPVQFDPPFSGPPVYFDMKGAPPSTMVTLGNTTAISASGLTQAITATVGVQNFNVWWMAIGPT